MATAKKPTAKKAASHKGSADKVSAPAPTAKPAAGHALAKRVAKSLGVSEAEVTRRALEELAERLEAPGGASAHAGKKSAPGAAAHADTAQPPTRGGLPQRLYLLLDGRGLDGRGMPVEVIQLPATIGSDRKCTVWINSPQIETRHLQITQEDEGWILEDLGSEKGTFLGDEPVRRRVIENGDEYRLAGYLRLRAELR